MIKEAISKVVDLEDLTTEEMVTVMGEIMGGLAEPTQIAAFITALRMKGETVSEITGAATVMREKALRVNVDADFIVDTCGTGGDASMTFNISTAAAFVVAGAGVTVAKHGNRSVSSKSGSADVLKALGVNIEVDIECVEECIKEVGIGFLFAPLLHGAMKYAAPVRRDVGIRTIFNILGPLTNPAGARHHLLGVYDPKLTDVMAEVLKNLGSKHAFVVAGDDGLDEITLTNRTKITELKGGTIKTYHVSPEDFGFERCALSDLRGEGPLENAKIIRDLLEGKEGPHRDIVLLNAAAGITAASKARSLEDGLLIARAAISSGNALKKLNGLIERTNS